MIVWFILSLERIGCESCAVYTASTELEHTMLITEKMVRAGVVRAIELGLLPRKSIPEDIATNRELIREILECTFDAVEEMPAPSVSGANKVRATT
jgi:hypothetical protein